MEPWLLLRRLDEWDSIYITCPLTRWEGDMRRCRVCNADLPTGRHRRYCSPECSLEGTSNHLWAQARVSALHRDGRACVECGGVPGWDRATGRWRTDARGPGYPVRLAVHHKIPVPRTGSKYGYGGGYAIGCQHHQDGLVTLCGACHLAAHAAIREQAAAQLTLGLTPSDA